ncbi:hypothetical protein [Arcticibacterium luteifluviistationis]|nr:hypothetical protein [Arcticibacterium luteifluviistationis]
MKNKSLLFLFLSISIFSCKKDDNSETIIPEEGVDTIQEEVNLMPEITADAIEQNSFSKMEVTLTPDNQASAKYLLDLSYDDNNRLKSVVRDTDTLYAYNYETDRVSVLDNGNQKTVYLNNDGLAKEIQGLTNQFKYYFKNDYFVRSTEVNSLKKDYSSEGNLVFYSNDELSAEYSYMDSLNTIRQEILTPLTFHWSFRDKYLGNFSTNLIKTAIFHDASLGDYTYTLNFSYEFDEENRVSKVIINRQEEGLSAVIEYALTY